jgi:molybdopterin-guanine dinucleotide biosynthesis protein A
MHSVSGLVLAGGHSARFGTDKRTVPLGGITLLDRAVNLLVGISGDLIIAVQRSDETRGAPGGGEVLEDLPGVRHGIRVIHDAMPDRGPMAGILAGLHQARQPRLLVIPVDMPMLTAAFLRFLVEVDPEAAVTVPSWQAGLEPLVAVYHAACAAAMAGFLARSAAAVHAFINATTLRVRRVEEQEIRRHADPSRLFLNINTPEDLTRAEALLRGSRPGDAPR